MNITTTRLHRSPHALRFSFIKFSRATMLVMLCVLFAASAASAADFIVTSTANSGAGTLRQAILDANQTAGADTIKFSIPGSGVQTISLTSVLPDITDKLTIDGYTQPNAKPNSLSVGTNAVLLVEINGAGIIENSGGSHVSGLAIKATGCTIRGLVINYFGGSNITVASANNLISGNFIGTDPTGSVAYLKDSGGDAIIINDLIGYYITTTATDTLTGDTSELSPCLQVTGQQLAQTIAPAEDTYVKGSTPNDNFGAAQQLQVKRTLNPGSGKGRQAYMRFDLSQFANSGVVMQATLRVRAKLNQTVGANINIPLGVFPLSDIEPKSDWSEHSLTWTGKPAPNAPQMLAQSIVASTFEQWHDLDVTAFVNQELAAGRRTVAFIVRNTAQGEPGDYYTQIQAKENGAFVAPQLVVVK